MRYVAFLLLIGILTVLSCTENDISPTRDNFRISKILNYSNSTSTQPYNTVEFLYDRNGNLTKESTLNYPNTLITYIMYEYAGDKLIKKNIYDGQTGNLTLGSFIHYSYNNGKVTKEELFLADGTLKYSTYFEYMGDKLINTYKVDGSLGIHHQYKYKFDNLNRLILEEVFMYNQELSEFTKYFYDNGNRLIKSEFYNPMGTMTSYIDKVYIGSSKLPSEEFYYDQNGTLTQKRQLSYDRWENLTEINVDYLGTTCQLFKRTYKGELLTEEIKYLPSFGCAEWTVTRYEYSKK